MPSLRTAPQAEAAHGQAGKRQAILTAALDCFEQHGFAGASLEEIALGAGVSKQTVYNHFGDKETLFLAVAEEAISHSVVHLHDAVDAFPIDTSHLREDLVALASHLLEVYMDPTTTSLRRLVFAEGARYPQLFTQWRRSTERVRGALTGHFARLGLAGRLVIVDPDRSARQFLTLVTGPAWQLSNLGTAPVTLALSQIIEENVDLFLAAHR